MDYEERELADYKKRLNFILINMNEYEGLYDFKDDIKRLEQEMCSNSAIRPESFERALNKMREMIGIYIYLQH